MTTFPSPWSQDEHLVTRFPGPVTVRYRSIVCRAAGVSVYGPGVVLWRCWQAEDPDLAESLGLPRRTEEVNPWTEMMKPRAYNQPLLNFLFPTGLLICGNVPTMEARWSLRDLYRQREAHRQRMAGAGLDTAASRGSR